MSNSPRLDLRQSQNLVMTPQLQQAIRLLQMSHQDLVGYVEQEIARNPLLESADEAPTSAPDGEDTPPPDATPIEGEAESAYQQTWDSRDDFTPLPTNLAQQGHGDDPFSADIVAETPSLRDHLTSQIQMDLTDPVARALALALLDHLNDAGYLATPSTTLCDQLGADPALFDTVLGRLQQMDPPGIFARSLAECLALQLRDKNRLDPAMDCLLQHLDLVARHESAALMRLCGVDAEDLADMLREIRTLNPKPADAFTTGVAASVIPDVFLTPKPDGTWLVELNPDALPRVLANERYYTKIQKKSKSDSPETKAYLSQNWQQATWLVKALNQRAQTILKVASEIVRQQEPFFQHGIQHLKPLVLRDIAMAIDMHESTVSRVTQNKYMMTPRGLFELKYFFSTALGTTGGIESVSAEMVRMRIKALIEAEPPTAILSDDQLTALLRREGIAVARRTVAKYRESLNIPTSSLRKRRARGA